MAVRLKVSVTTILCMFPNIPQITAPTVVWNTVKLAATMRPYSTRFQAREILQTSARRALASFFNGTGMATKSAAFILLI